MRFAIINIITCVVITLLPSLVNGTPMAGFFDTVKTVGQHSRIDVADELYERKLKRMDSSYVITSLKQLIAIADSLDDQVLKCYTYSTLGDYYARIRGFNALSTELHYRAIDIAKGSGGSKIAVFMSDFKLGRYYYNFKKYPNAFEFLLRANYLAKEEGYGDDVESDELLFFLARAYHETGDYQNAAYYYTESLKYNDVFKGNYRIIQTYNGLAAIAQDNGDFTLAHYYLNQIIKFTKTKKDSTWLGLAKGFTGNIYFLENKYDSAETFLTEGFLNDTQHHEWIHATTTMLNLAAISVAKKKFQLADKYLADAKTSMQHANNLANRKQWYDVMAKYYEKKGDIGAAFIFTKKLQLAEDSLLKEKKQQDYYKIQMQVATEKHLNDVAKLDAQASAATLKRNLIIVILFLLMLLTLVVYNRQRQKRRSEKTLFQSREALLQSEKKRAQEELRNAMGELNSYTQNIREKNDLVEKVSAELELLKNTLAVGGVAPEKLEYFDKLVQSTILTANEWDTFRQMFDKVHKGFFFKLKQVFPNLSEADTRLLSLIKLQLSNREMSNMLGVGTDAIKKAKQRLRKKLPQLDEAKELEDIIANI